MQIKYTPTLLQYNKLHNNWFHEQAVRIIYSEIDSFHW